MGEVTRVWLIRHGEPDPSARGRCYGSLDVGLSPVGVSQAHAVAGRLSSEPISAVYSSPRLRTLQTARILSKSHHLEVEIDRGLSEIDFGDFEGCEYTEIQERYPSIYKEWMEHPTRVEFPNGESFDRMRLRVTTAFAPLLDRHEGATFAIVTHGGVNRILLAEALGMDPERIFRLGQRFAALNLIRYIGGFPVVELLNAGT